MLIGHQIGILAFLGALLLIALSNLRAMRRLGNYPMLRRYPPVSILVPARNEEHNIAACVESLLEQVYPDCEVLVMDDHSTDCTGKILVELAEKSVRLRLLEGTTLPHGWLGKHWACQQLAEASTGEVILFMDADTRLTSPHALRDAVVAMAAEQADLLTLLPRQEVETWAERLVIPIIPWSLHSFLPLEVAYRVKLPALSAAIGQFMMFRREAYEAVGGHQAVRRSVVDDIDLAKRIKAQGLRWRLVDGAARVSCRMYRTPREVFNGISRTLYGVFGRMLPVHLFVWVWLGIVFLEPPVVLILLMAGVPVGASLSLAFVSSAAALMVWGIALRRFGFPIYLILFYPVIILLAVFLALWSPYQTLTGRVTWKGRSTAIPGEPGGTGAVRL